jgi:hypothetical protein
MRADGFQTAASPKLQMFPLLGAVPGPARSCALCGLGHPVASMPIPNTYMASDAERKIRLLLLSWAGITRNV